MRQAYGNEVSPKDAAARLSIEITSTTRAMVLESAETSLLGTVIENRVLTQPGVPAKHHIGQCCVHGVLLVDSTS